MNKIVLTLLGAVVALSPVSAEAKELPRKVDKAYYCSHVLMEAARVIAASGDPVSGRIIRERGKTLLTFTYYPVAGFTRSEVKALKPRYEAEAKTDVAAKRYRYNDCSAADTLAR
jgi:hypothetical protein